MTYGIAYLLPNTGDGIMETKESLSLKSLLIWAREGDTKQEYQTIFNQVAN